MSAGSLQAQLNHIDLFRLKWVIGGILFLVSGWSLLPAEQGSNALLIVALLIVGATLFVPKMVWDLPPALWKLCTPGIICFTVADFLMSAPDFIPPLVRLITLLALLRTLAPRRQREDMQQLLLCLFMVIIAGVFTVSLLFAFQLLLVAPLIMLQLLIVTLGECHRSQEPIPHQPWRDFSWSAFRGRLLRATNWRMVLLAAGLFSLLLACSSVIFLAMPRFRLDQAIPFLNVSGRATYSGFTEQIRFGDFVDILQDNSVALRVDVEWSQNQNPPSDIYWRMLVLDEYHQGGFRLSDSARRPFRNESGLSIGSHNPSEERERQNLWTFYLESNLTRYLPLLGSFDFLRFPKRTEFAYNSMLRLMRVQEIPASVLSFQVENMRPTDWMPWDAEDRRLRGRSPLWLEAGMQADYPFTTLALPGDNTNRSILEKALADIRAFNAGSLPEEALPFAAVAARWLEDGRGYSLRTRIPSGQGDTLCRWIASGLSGHCELYAGALVLLARAQGIPARVVTGFQGGTWNGYENYYMVRNRDAHAWVELFDGRLWRRYDPTPGNRLDQQTAAASSDNGFLAIDRTLSAYLDSLRIIWYRRIVNYDEAQQKEITSQIRSWWDQLIARLRETILLYGNSLRSFANDPWSGESLLKRAENFLLLLTLYLLCRFTLLALLRRAKQRGGRIAALHEAAIRRTAGRWLIKLNSRQTFPSNTHQYELLNALRNLRFGPSNTWPDPTTTFANARQASRQPPLISQ